MDTSMQLYAIFRRRGWTAETIADADARSRREAGRRADELRKIRSYVLAEPDGTLGSICLYEATGPGVIEAHARAAELPCDDIVQVTAIDVLRPDPELLDTAPA